MRGEREEGVWVRVSVERREGRGVRKDMGEGRPF